MTVAHIFYILAAALWIVWTYYSIKDIKEFGLFNEYNRGLSALWQIVHIFIPIIMLVMCLIIGIVENWNTVIL